MNFDTSTRGQLAQDKLSGLEGMIYAVCIFASGQCNICLKPLGLDKDGKPQDYRWIESKQIESLGDTHHLEPEALNEQVFELHQRVRHVQSGLEGSITDVTYWFNGCVRYGVSFDGVNSKTGRPFDSQDFDDYELEAVLDSESQPQSTEIKPSSPRTQGGPQREPSL